MNKKAQISQLTSLVIPLVGIAIVLAVGFLIMAEVKSQPAITGSCNQSTGVGCTNAFNGTTEVQNAMSDIPGWLPIIVIVIIGSLLIGLVALFRGRQ